MHRRLLAGHELHRSQVDSLSQARHQGNVSQCPQRHHLTAAEYHVGRKNMAARQELRSLVCPGTIWRGSL